MLVLQGLISQVKLLTTLLTEIYSNNNNPENIQEQKKQKILNEI